MRPVLAGATGGLFIAAILSRVLAGVTSLIGGADLPTLAGTVILLATVAGTAALLPARRAAGVDPVVALRGE
jgi:ABC-type antimicrobial peptide transport system permease subunit